MLKHESYESLGIFLRVLRRPSLIQRHAPCEILPPTHTLPVLSEVMMDHNLMKKLDKHCYTVHTLISGI